VPSSDFQAEGGKNTWVNCSFEPIPKEESRLKFGISDIFLMQYERMLFNLGFYNSENFLPICLKNQISKKLLIYDMI